MRRRSGWRRLTGVAFVVVLIIGFIVGGEPPDVKNPPQEIVDHYVDNKDSVQIGVLLEMIAAALLLFFAGYLRKVLRAAPGEGGMLPAVALAGATVMAAGAAIDATISFVLAESRRTTSSPPPCRRCRRCGTTTGRAIALGAAVLAACAAASSIALYGALPRWLGWVAIVARRGRPDADRLRRASCRRRPVDPDRRACC